MKTDNDMQTRGRRDETGIEGGGTEIGTDHAGPDPKGAADAIRDGERMRDRVEPPRRDRNDPPTRDEGPSRPDQPQAPPPAASEESQSERTARASAYWQGVLFEHGPDAVMDALRAGDPSVKDALKDPMFLWALQEAVKQENELISLVSNMIDIQHRNAMASIQNMRV